jgi:5-methylcytosine-specific restriction endonuclease McrA
VHALVLNATYEPLSVVPERRAAVLVLRGRAVIQEPSGKVLHAATVQLPIPSVARLTRYVRVPYRGGMTPTRAAVFARDGHRCQYCDAPADSLDHVIPRSRGGGHEWENVVACCRRCNLRKGDRLPAEVGYRLRRPPARPSRFDWVYARAGRIHPSWESYLAS